MLKNSMFDKQRFNLLDIKRLWWLERHSHGQIAVNVAGIARCGKWWISNGYLVASFGALAEIEEDMGI